ncbi:hypothetical protein KKA49_00165, partial [Patescibacteria group bacterium]|nr:hypothetical protein [Patescibacteria group bacterium]MBU1457610.1 hypothetical protein [Patescibacteria group bacterium]
MSIKHRNSLKKLFKNVILACPESGLAILVLVHLFFIYLGGYFLSPEFTVYPYLTSIGLKPYVNIVDQHLPIILFGPLSLPHSLTSNPQPLLGLFLSLVAITDLLFFHLIKKTKTKNSILWTALFAASLFVFQGNTLWLETFIIPLVLLLFFLKRPFFVGMLSALIILTRPTLAPAVLLLLIFKKLKLSRYLIAGFLAPLLLTLTYLIYHQLLPDFIYLFFSFNTTYYSALAGKLPSLRQIALVGLVTIPVLTRLFTNKKYLSIFIIILAFLPAWPRFELTHLQPAIALAIYFWATNKPLGHSKATSRSVILACPESDSGCTSFTRMTIERLLLVTLIFLSIRKITTANYGNFYLNPETQEVSSFIKTQEENQLFVLGGSDLIY